jgi:hypothetical protein
MDHDSIIDDWRQNAEKNDDENYDFLRSLKSREYGFEPDELCHELHQQAFEIVDCTRCANCCRTMDIRFEDDDIDRIAGHLGVTVDAFTEAYLEVDDEGGGYRAREKPCPFLADDHRCTIYDVRPTVCREYPHTDKEGLVFRTMGVANNTLVCPAVFWIVEQIKQEAHPAQRDREAGGPNAGGSTFVSVP